MKFSSLKGIQDIYAPEILVWQHIEETARETFGRYGYSEIRLPIIEYTDIFTRSIGEITDIVEKEMYTFTDRGGRSVTLRPEGTASLVRAFIQNHLYREPSPQKYFYMGPMFRYERPQAFRYRQFHQIGIEALGTENPVLDAEVLSMLYVFLKNIGLGGISVEITSIGCRDCRPGYKTALKEALKSRLDLFCEDCNRRFDTNPLRILDCKVPSCTENRKGSPVILDFLCDECKRHFEKLKHGLLVLDVPYAINPAMVRGLDYYTRTAFEVSSESLGSQKAIAAGGRYDSLVSDFGGPSTPGIGFAIGVERILPLIKGTVAGKTGPDIFFCSLGDAASEVCLSLSERLRAEGLWVEMNYDESSSLKSQMRKADRINAQNVIVIGENELQKKTAIIKSLVKKQESEIALETKEIVKALTVQGTDR